MRTFACQHLGMPLPIADLLHRNRWCNCACFCFAEPKFLLHKISPVRPLLSHWPSFKSLPLVSISHKAISHIFIFHYRFYWLKYSHTQILGTTPCDHRNTPHFQCGIFRWHTPVCAKKTSDPEGSLACLLTYLYFHLYNIPPIKVLALCISNQCTSNVLLSYGIAFLYTFERKLKEMMMVNKKSILKM